MGPVSEEPPSGRTQQAGGPDPRGDDFRRGPRRRGRALEDAIYRAALDDLAEHGFDGLSIERIAHRAGTGKSAIYRRWAPHPHLLLAPPPDPLPPPRPPPTLRRRPP